MASVTDVNIALQSGTTDTLYCSWKCTLSNVDHFEVQWNYNTGDGWSFDGGSHTVTPQGTHWNNSDFVDTYTPPSNYVSVTAYVKPVSKTHTVNNVEVSYWSGTWTQAKYSYWKMDTTPEVPATPDVEIEGDPNSSGKYKLTMTLSDLRDDLTDYIEFYIRKDSQSKVGSVYAKKSSAYSCMGYYYVSPGATYSIAARAINNFTGGAKSTITLVDGSSATLYSPVYSDWSSFSGEYSPPPDTPTNVKASAFDETVVQITWRKPVGATGYEVQYSEKKEYLEKYSNEVSSQTVDEDTDTAYLTGLEAGKEYFIRVRATNDAGESGWSDIISAIIGTTPEPPTTWSSTTTAMIGDLVTVFWVHNCEDGSDQTQAQIEFIPNNSGLWIETINGTDNSYVLDTSGYSDGTEITWQVRTAGITGKISDWSTARKITINAPATLALIVPDVVESFPINIYAEAGPSSQRAISYHISIKAKESYEVTGPTGQTLRINAGEEIYSKLYNMGDDYLIQVVMPISVGDVTLQDGQKYTVTVSVVMNTGLTAETSGEFEVRWSDELYEPFASVGLDSENLISYISPYCERLVDFEDGDDPDTATRELVSNVTLSVYRREPDGTFTLIGDGIENTGVAAVTDPHPALDYARYRIVAQNVNTGQISYEDLPGLPFNQPYVVIQWDEDWTDFEFAGEAKMVSPAWSGSMIKIPYNIDVSEAHDPDSELVEYIGRSHPVGYYGTQLGESGSWSMDVPKDDEEIIYALRRLAIYMGDVYVREPSGTGYWAQITVSMNTNHCNLVVPVSLSVNRVEGDM